MNALILYAVAMTVIAAVCALVARRHRTAARVMRESNRKAYDLVDRYTKHARRTSRYMDEVVDPMRMQFGATLQAVDALGYTVEIKDEGGVSMVRLLPHDVDGTVIEADVVVH